MPLKGLPRRWEILILFSAAVLVAWQLFVPPALSVANDNDFSKLAGRFCIGPDPRVGNELFDYANVHWMISKQGCILWSYRSSAELVVYAALGLNRLFGHPPKFDLRWVGLVYALLFLGIFAWTQRLLRPLRPATNLAFQLAFLLTVCNAVYIPLFNTFYLDTIALVAMMGALAGLPALLTGEAKMGTFLVTVLMLALLGASKSQHSLLAAACLPALWLPRGRKIFPPIWARAAGSTFVLLCAALAVLSTPPETAGQATFNTLFYRLLPSVSNPADYLAEAHIPTSYLAAIGTHSYSPGSLNASVESEIAFGRMFGLLDLVRLFSRHPGLAWHMLMIHLDEASLDRVRMKTGTTEHRLANYERTTGKPPQSLSHFFGLWPAVKHGLIANRPRLYLAYVFSVVAGAWLLRPRRPGVSWLLGIVTAMLALSFGVVMLDGLDSGRHLQMFNFLLDLLVCAMAAFGAERFSAA